MPWKTHARNPFNSFSTHLILSKGVYNSSYNQNRVTVVNFNILNYVVYVVFK